MNKEKVIEIIQRAQERVYEIRALDRIIENVALQSYRERNAFRTIQRIDRLRRKKDILIEEALQVKRIMQQLKPKEYTILVHTVVRGWRWKDVKDMYKCSMRTFCRYKSNALNKLGKLFENAV